MRSFDNRKFDSAPLEPIAVMPVAVIPVNVMVHINVTVDDPVRLSVLAKR